MQRHVLCLLFTLAFFATSENLAAQYANHTLPQYPDTWNSHWITHPEIDKGAYGLIHFRNSFDLEEKPNRFVVHLSGDNRYRLHVNGTEVCYGPQLADLRHWRYETIDLASFLKAGENTVAVEVMNWGVERSYGIMSHKTGFLLQGNSKNEWFLNTNRYNRHRRGVNDRSQWKVLENKGVNQRAVAWRGGAGDVVGGFYASNPTDLITASRYPWGWKEIRFDDRDWQSPEDVFSDPNTRVENGHGWILQPRTTAIQTSQAVPFTRVARSDLKSLAKDFQFGKTALEIPAHSHHTLLIDQGHVTVGYPKLTLSGGQDARVEVIYSEALYDANNLKGNRDEIEGKTIKGIRDVYLMDGSDQREFQPLWFRTFRFIQLEIETQEAPLRIDDYFHVSSASSFPVIASFKTDHPLYQQVWDLCWHTMEVCAQDNLISDAYYEQMQYVGDLRPHLKGWTALTGDLTYFHSALEQFNNSRLPDGNVTSCYPLKATFVHPPFSLVWCDMLHDLMMLEGDPAKIEGYQSEIQEVFDYYESLINEKGLVGKSEYQMFVDWYLPRGGNSPVNKDGNSAILTLNYAYSLQHAAELVNWLGHPEVAKSYRDRGQQLAEIVRGHCFDEQKGIYADDPEKTYYDQRASVLAVLCGAHSKNESQALMKAVVDPNTPFDSHANLFYYFYLFEAMQKTGVGDFTQQLQPWNEILKMGMSGTPEKRIEQHPRSDIHPWTAHPVHAYFSVVAGITPTSPGFRTVEIAPNLGALKSLQLDYPTINGKITMDLTSGPEGVLSGQVMLPENVQGVFRWQGTEVNLSSGLNHLRNHSRH